MHSQFRGTAGTYICRSFRAPSANIKTLFRSRREHFTGQWSLKGPKSDAYSPPAMKDAHLCCLLACASEMKSENTPLDPETVAATCVLGSDVGACASQRRPHFTSLTGSESVSTSFLTATSLDSLPTMLSRLDLRGQEACERTQRHLDTEIQISFCAELGRTYIFLLRVGCDIVSCQSRFYSDRCFTSNAATICAHQIEKEYKRNRMIFALIYTS